MVKQSRDIKQTIHRDFQFGTLEVLLCGPYKLESSEVETDLVFDAPDGFCRGYIDENEFKPCCVLSTQAFSISFLT